MNDVTETPYPSPMLPDVDYQKFDEDFEPLVDLEFGTLQNIRGFLEKLEHALLNAKMAQIPELIVAHLSSYLGSVIAVYKANKAKDLEPAVLNLLKQHAELSFSKFNQYPVNSSVDTQPEKQANLSQLREDSPGSIVPQTVRLGRIVMDMMERLGENRNESLNFVQQKQDDLLCPQTEFFAFLIPLANEQHQDWQKALGDKSINHAINQLTIQIGWLIGYFAHLETQSPAEGEYLEYALPCVSLHLEYTDELLQAMRAKGQVLTSMHAAYDDEVEEAEDIDPVLESLHNDIRVLSQKTHADLPPAINRPQKETAIFQAGLEKLVIELIMEKKAVKILLMSIFYFWFTLDAPLRGVDPKKLDDFSPFDEMVNIIDLVKSTTAALPEPELTPELKALNAKMQQIKSYLPDPASFDEISQADVTSQTTRVNTAIHTLTSDYMRQDFHPEIIANVLFNQWLRLSVFYGVSESDWQKMDHYFVEILTAVREYLPTVFK